MRCQLSLYWEWLPVEPDSSDALRSIEGAVDVLAVEAFVLNLDDDAHQT